MNLKILLGAAIAAFLFVGCSSPRFFVDSQWTNKPAKAKFIFSTGVVENQEDLDDVLVEDENFTVWFARQLEENVKFYSNHVDFTAERISKEEMLEEKVTLGKNPVTVGKPKTFNSDAEIYVVLNNLWFGRTQRTSYYTHNIAAGTPTTSSTNYFISMSGRYAFYDTRTQKILGYGEFNTNEEYVRNLGRDSWKRLIQTSIEEILENTPLTYPAAK
ncbi:MULTISPECIES: hypothetical protein [unclassified Fibrobacter]|uniref:hypothetical protein n=1 Tax=unclassified Fibrobacter TaxID=2634177 RepID=UPI0009249C01|nr:MULTISPECIES: hypothetical protein [unclassified Fibrobacter]OWV07245.1 hypothetical protein B7993_03265 [Fibrobacter sp. UWH3]OWV15868.1 hypothetical protein B7992_03595 [Fibrobacter sp. UWH1]SHK80730.1 hypothetical protein SAMN05720765_10598 [Fibrobacter sp. UWH6]